MKPTLGGLLAVSVLGWGLSLPGSPVRGDVVVLTSGGRVVGQIVPRDPPDPVSITVRLPSGGQVTLSKSQVRQIIRQQPEEMEYEKIRPRYPDTVEGQAALAQWCQEHKLAAQRKKHLRRVIQLDPNHEEARRALGYQRHGDEWLTRDELMQKQGYRRYKGRWCLPQEIELMEQHAANEPAEKEWMQKLALWRRWLGTTRDRLGRDSIRGISDSTAVKALSEKLENESDEHARKLYIDALGNIDTPAARKVLTARSMQEPVEEVSLSCLEVLKDQGASDAVGYYLDRLRSKDPGAINRAAVCLRHLEASEAVGPLIDALATARTFPAVDVVARNPVPSGEIVTYHKRMATRPVGNRSVLEALVALTGVNHGFDVNAWKNWYRTRQR